MNCFVFAVLTGEAYIWSLLVYTCELFWVHMERFQRGWGKGDAKNKDAKVSDRHSEVNIKEEESIISHGIEIIQSALTTLPLMAGSSAVLSSYEKQHTST